MPPITRVRFRRHRRSVTRYRCPVHSASSPNRDSRDAELVTRICAGDERAWPILVRRYADLVFRVARAACDDDDTANDAAQGTWLRFLEHAHRIAEPAAVRGWLATTARREAIALNKRTTRQRPHEAVSDMVDAAAERHGESAPDDPAALASDRDDIRILLEEMDQLSEKCRSLLTLYALKFSYAEIAETLGIQPGGVSPSRARCLEQLRRSPGVARLERARDGHE